MPPFFASVVPHYWASAPQLFSDHGGEDLAIARSMGSFARMGDRLATRDFSAIRLYLV